MPADQSTEAPPDGAETMPDIRNPIAIRRRLMRVTGSVDGAPASPREDDVEADS